MCIVDRFRLMPVSAVSGPAEIKKLCTTGEIIQLMQAQIISTPNVTHELPSTNGIVTRASR